MTARPGRRAGSATRRASGAGDEGGEPQRCPAAGRVGQAAAGAAGRVSGERGRRAGVGRRRRARRSRGRSRVARGPGLHCCGTRRTFPVERFPVARREGAPSGERRRPGRPVEGVRRWSRRRDRTVTMRQDATKHRTRTCRDVDKAVTRRDDDRPGDQATAARRRGRSRSRARPASVAATSSRTPRWIGRDMCPTPAHQHVAGAEVGVVAAARAGGHAPSGRGRCRSR